MHLELYQYLFLANGLDILTGISNALATSSLSSKKLKSGALSKVGIWIVVSVSFIVQDYLNVDIGAWVIAYYLIMELISVLENLSDFIPIPDKLKSLLEQCDVVKEPQKLEESVDDSIQKLIEEKQNEHN